jgi:hypothetical protein
MRATPPARLDRCACDKLGQITMKDSRAQRPSPNSSQLVDRSGRPRMNFKEGPEPLLVAFGWIGIYALSQFMWTKVDFNTEGTGWLLLPVAAATACAIVLLRLARGDTIRLGSAFTFTVLFLTYFLLRLIQDSTSTVDFLGYSVLHGTGLISAYFMGLFAHILVDAACSIQKYCVDLIGSLVFLTWNLQRAFWIWSETSGAADIANQNRLAPNDDYQLSGVMAAAIALLTSMVVVKVSPLGRALLARILRTSIYCLVGLVFATLIHLVQIMGSNAGPAFIVPLALIAYSVLLVPLGGGPIPRHYRGGRDVTASFSSRLVGVGVASVLLSGIFMCILWLAVWIDWIELSRYRIFGFDETTLINSSVRTRLDLLVSNFQAHTAFSPWWGHMFVDRILTGTGTYTHSLISLLPHTGVVGSALFVLLLYGTWRELRRCWVRAAGDSREIRLAMFSTCAVAWSIVYVTAGAFFTSPLVWLPLGALVPLARLERSSRRTCRRQAAVRAAFGDKSDTLPVTE